MNLALKLDNNITRPKTNMRDIFRPKAHNIHHMANRRKRNTEKNYNNVVEFKSKSHKHSHEHSHSKVLKFDKTFELYLDEVEKVTKVPILQEQRDLLKNDINNHEYTRLSAEQTKEHRKEFGRVRKELIADWEAHTHMKWNTYQEDKIYNGKIIRRKGQLWDAHELHLNSWGSTHHWYNITPAPNPEHQNIIHGKGSMADRIFN